MKNLKMGDIVVYEDKEYIVVEETDNEQFVLEDNDSNTITVDADSIIIQDELDEETKAASTIKGKANWSVSQMTAKVLDHLSSLSPSDQTKFFDSVQGQFGAGKDHGVPSGAASKNKNSVDTKNPNSDTQTPGQMASKVKSLAKEDLDKLLQGTEGLTEEFKEQAATIFEAAVSLRVGIIEDELQEQYAEKLDEEMAELTERLEDNIDQYISHIAEEWISENEVAIESTLKTEISENFMSDLYELFGEYNFELPESKVDMVEEMTSEIDSLKEQLNDSLAANMELVEAVEEFSAETIFEEVSEGMAVSQAEKFRKLVEDIDFDGDEDSYRNKIDVIKTKYFSEGKSNSTLNEEVNIDEPKKEVTDSDPTMNRYVQAISKSIKR